MFERRRRRKSNKTTTEKKPPKKTDVDPYDSDPGQSYRDHCKKNRVAACLTVPKFIKNRVITDGSVLTAPPSPTVDMPSSLPAHWARVRYSLRSAITDGSEKQPVGPSVMERRDLRPNDVELNVSHWSDEGERQYMEDRYVMSNLYYFAF